MTNPAFIRRTIARLTSRTLLPLAAMVAVAIGICGGTAEAGIVTSMSSGMSALDSEDSRHTSSHEADQDLPQLQQPSLFELPQNPSGSSSSSTSSTSGPSQSFAAASDTLLIGGLPRSGWITPEAVQALPPLLPSGLFRPPCA